MLSNPNMTLIEFAEKIGNVELEPWQRSILRRFEQMAARGEKIMVNLFPVGRARRVQYVAKSADTNITLYPAIDHDVTDGPVSGIRPAIVIWDDPYGDDRRWESDAWMKDRG
jgi:hypothetical protein